MAEIDSLEISIVADTSNVDHALKNLQDNLRNLSSKMGGFGEKMNTSGITNKFKGVSASLANEEKRIKKISSDLAEDFINNFNISDGDIQNKVRSLTDSIFGALKRDGLKISIGDTKGFQQQLVETVLGNGKILSEEAAERKKILQEFYDDLISYYNKYGAIKLPDGMKLPSFEGIGLSGKMFSKTGNDLTGSSFINERYTHLFSEDDLKTQEDIISRIVGLVQELKSSTGDKSLGNNEISYMLNSIIESAQKAVDVLKEPAIITNRLQKKYADLGKDWNFTGDINSVSSNIKNLENQLENAKIKQQELILKDRVDSSAYEDVIAKISILTNKIEILKSLLGPTKVDLQDMSNVPVAFENSAVDLQYYIDKLKEFQNIASSDKPYISDENGYVGSLSSEIERTVQYLQEEYPQAKNLIEDYEKLFNSVYVPENKPAVFTIPDVSGQVENQSSKIDKLKSKLGELSSKAKETFSSFVPKKYSEDFVFIENEIEKTTQKLNKLQEKVLELENTAGNSRRKSNALKGYQDQIDQTRRQLSTLKSERQSMLEDGSAYESAMGDMLSAIPSKVGLVISVLKKVHHVLQKIFNIIVKIAKFIGKIIGSIGSAMLSPFKKILSAFGSIDIKSSKLYKSISRIFKMFRLMIIRRFLNMFITGYADAFKALIKFSDETNRKFSMLYNSINTFKNSIVAATAPIINMFAPALSYLINLCTRVINVINQLLSALSGASYWIKAKKQTDDYAKSLGSVNKQLASIDELNNLSSGSGSGDLDPSGMFENAPIDEKIKKIGEAIRNFAAKLFEPIQEAWEKWKKPFQASYKYMANEIKSLIKSIARDWLIVWSEDNTRKIFENIILMLTNINLGIGNIARNFREAWDMTDSDGLTNGYHILAGIRDVMLVISEKAKEIAVDFNKWTYSLNFEPLLQKLGPYIESLTGPIGFLGETIRSFIKEVLEPLGKWVLEDGLPQLLEIFTAFNDQVEWDRLNPMVSEFWKVLEKFGEKVGQGLIDFISDLVSGLSDWLNNGGYDKLETWLGKIESWMENTKVEDVTKLLKDFFSVIKKVAEILLTFAKVIDTVAGSSSLGDLSTKIKNIKDNIVNFTDKILLSIPGVSQFKATLANLKTVITILKTVTSNFNVGEKIKKSFEKVKDTVQSVIEKIEILSNMLKPSFWIKKLGDVVGILGSSDAIDTNSIPSYYNGGMVEDGLFFANHNELIGGFTNGRTAVANNEQIVAGIQSGVAMAVSNVVAPYLDRILSKTTEIANKDIEVSTDGLFRNVRNSAYSFSKRTGRDAFSF